MNELKVILFMAMSLNGIVARKNDSEDFLPHYGWEKFVELAKDSGGFIIGRKTYSVVRKNYDNFGFDYLHDMVKVVLSRSSNFEHNNDIVVASGIEESLDIAKEAGLNSVILTGGSTVNTEFAKLGLIDEIIFNVEPVVIGEGIKVFKEDNFDLKLEPLSINNHPDGGYTLRYKVIK